MSLVRFRPEAPAAVMPCGFSSFGRARPCQGRGSGFEPRNPLHQNGYDNNRARLHSWRHSQAVRQRSAKPLFPGSIPGGASKCSGLKRCRTENRRFSPVFFVFLAFPRFFKNRIFAKIKRCKTPFSTFHPEPDRWTTISGRFFEGKALEKPPFL